MKAISWRTLEHVHKEKSSDWFWVVGIIALAVAVTSVIFGNIMFGLLVAVASFVMALFAAQPPQEISVELTEKGVHVERSFYPYRSLKSFSIDEDHHDGVRLVIQSSRAVFPYIAIPIPQDEAEIDRIKEFLSHKLKEEHFEDNPLHALFEKLWF